MMSKGVRARPQAESGRGLHAKRGGFPVVYNIQ